MEAAWPGEGMVWDGIRLTTTMMEGGPDGGGGRELAFAWPKRINKSSQDESGRSSPTCRSTLMRRIPRTTRDVAVAE